MLTIVVLAFALQISPPAHRSEQQKPSDKKTDIAKPSQTPSPVTIPENQENPCKKSSATTTESQKIPEKSFWGDLPTWMLVFVGGVAAWIALCTLKDIQKQTTNARLGAKAAKKSADAALKNAEAIVNAERAWIDGYLGNVDPSCGPDWADLSGSHWFLTATNHGRTPAYIESIEIGIESLPGELRTFEKRTLSRTYKEIHLFLPAGQTTPTPLHDFDLAQDFSDWMGILSGQKTGVIEITIRYKDIVSASTRETYFAYSYSIVSAGLKRLNWMNEYK